MTSNNKTILVLGATGQQGGAAAAHLLADGWKVRVLTRDIGSRAAQALAQRGAELAEGDMGDRAALDRAMQGVYGVFSVQPSEWNINEIANDMRLGNNVADAAQAAGVQHLVYSSIVSADEQAAFRAVSKWEIEKHIHSLGIPYTILRLPYFMENYVNFSHYGIQNGRYAEAINPDVPIPLIAVEDIGVFAMLAFKHPDKFLGRTIELAGDALTPPEIAAAISRASGHPVAYSQIPLETIRGQNETLGRIYDWINGGGFRVDIGPLRELHPDLMSFEQWLGKSGKLKLEALFHSHQTDQ